ncbi:hypothetical protein CB1_002524019 [Camelus ferus]|nr:hypothetical protein CB1_002524019 [Camelus ferus]
MAERKQSGKAAEDEEVPAFFKNLGSGSPKPRQKFCGMFCPVEGSSENKTIDFDSLSVGRGSGQVEIRRASGKEALQNINDQREKNQGGVGVTRGTATLLNNPCGDQSSAKYLSKGFPQRSPPPLSGKGFGDED